MDIFEKFYNDVKETIDPKNLLSNDEIVYWLKKDIAELEAAQQSVQSTGGIAPLKEDDPEK